MIIKKCDIAIVGSGLAGVASAIELAKQNYSVAIICNQDISKIASYYAQGGIAAVTSSDDSIELHSKDTLVASSHTAKANSVNQVVANSYNAIKWLEENGVNFDRNNDKDDYSLHLEGGHSIPRVLHIKDYTGKAVLLKLYDKLKTLKNIKIYHSNTAFKLIEKQQRCIGVLSYNDKGEITKFNAKNVILAAGGGSGIYKYVTNANASTGSAMIMAHDIGCELENLEFTQFHPTCFFDKDNIPILISEAVRGKGATLERESGLRIMEGVHPQKDLAPRDVVARQIYINMQAGFNIFLNATHLNNSQWQNTFPYIYDKLLQNNIDPTKDIIPISPAAHYSCGGIKVNCNSETQIKGLYSIGEVSCTGLHGANRLASNSLLECVVYALIASKNIINKAREFVECNEKDINLFESQNNYSKDIAQVKQILWDSVGVVRNKEELIKTKHKLKALESNILDNCNIKNNSFDYKLDYFAKILKLAQLTVDSAIERKDSVGSHYLV